jgi:hypothetical protein
MIFECVDLYSPIKPVVSFVSVVAILVVVVVIIIIIIICRNCASGFRLTVLALSRLRGNN